MGFFDRFGKRPPEQPPAAKPPMLDLPLAAPDRDLVDAMGSFNLALNAREGGNVVSSAFSIYEAWLRVWGGSVGECRAEIGRALGLQESADVRAELQRLVAQLSAASAMDCAIRTTNAIWVRPGLVVDPDFETEWGGAIRELDFTDAEGAARTVNAWVEEGTNGMIRDILDPRQIAKHMALLLANAVSLDARWAEPFLDFATADAVFHAPDGEVQVPMMWHRSDYLCVSTADFELVSKSYVGDDVAFVVVLPRSGKFADVRARLTWATMRAALDGSESRDTILRLPKFEVDGSPQVDELLRGRGAVAIYDSRTAHLTGLSPMARKPGEELFVGQTIHQARIEVTEDGTRAAAATLVPALAGSAPSPKPPPYELTVDRPFLFFVIARESRTPLFAGHVVDPR